jgi:hypothetical protein
MHKGYRAFSQSPLHQNTRDHIPQPLPVVAGDESSLGCAHPSVDQVMARVSGESVSRHRVFFKESSLLQKHMWHAAYMSEAT